MPDFFNPRAMEGAPNGWSEAFAALPMETPTGDGWARIVRALDAPVSRRGAARRERRMSWLMGIASAAVLVLAAWTPLSRWLHGNDAEAHAPTVATRALGLRGPAAPAYSTPIEDRAGTKVVARDAHVATSVTAAKTTSHRRPTAKRGIAKRSPAPAGHGRTVQIAAPEADGTSDAAVATSTSEDPLQRLKVQSAQLEALVSLARDDRVANASSELLSNELDTGIAAVDAALSQAGLTESRRQELWLQRVDLLQQLAGVEATSRWLAAQGISNNTTLVSVD
jgi:hypothetical protein